MHLADFLVMLEGTYIFVGTLGIPLHTWHALPSETARVTLWPEGYSRPDEQGSQTLCLTSLRNEAQMHCEHELTGFVTTRPTPLTFPSPFPLALVCSPCISFFVIMCCESMIKMVKTNKEVGVYSFIYVFICPCKPEFHSGRKSLYVCMHVHMYVCIYFLCQQKKKNHNCSWYQLHWQSLKKSNGSEGRMTYTWSVGFKARSHGKGLCHSLHNWCLSKRWTRQVRRMVDAESLFY